MFHNAVVLETCGEISHVEENDGVFVQVFLKRRVGGNFKVGEKVARVARLVVIGTQHLGSHRLAKASATTDTAEATLCKKRAVDNGYQA
jgi:hypothetical protein